MLNKWHFVGILAVVINLYDRANTQDILGCGGFVKSAVEINFSVVEVKLYTKQGSLKYQTDCAPNSGYYMIPVYDKGDYILKVEPPVGWTFEPESVELHIDGSTDACSKGEDINFQFRGFGVVGKVISKGQSDGPAGVTLTLMAAGSSEVQQTIVSQSGGVYTFENVLPGEYSVKASHPSFAFEKDSVSVSVQRETGHAGSSISVLGYDFTGSVQSDGEPVRGVSFLLFSTTVSAKDIRGCQTSAVTGYPGNKPLCHVTSGADGTFAFPSLPHGQYKVVPFYKGEKITFDVVPAQLEFSVDHGSVKLDAPFQVAGFSVQGRVLNSAKGAGINGARVMLDGRLQATTGPDGSYHLDSMKPGTYTLQVEADKIYFEPTSVKVTPNTPQLPDIIASKFSLCGKVTIDKVPEGLHISPNRQIALKVKGQSAAVMTLTSDDGGNFCAKVKPDTYVLEVILSDEEIRGGLKLAPTQKEVVVTDASVEGVTFSQFRARVSGTIKCLETCGVIRLSLTAIGRSDEKMMTQANEVSRGATFQFEDVMPGKYKVTLLQDEWCWVTKTFDIEVIDKDVKDLDFVQSGYILSCSLSHDITLNFEHESKPGTVGSFNLTRGVNKFCLAEPGVYRLLPESCHQFEQDVYRYDTSSPTVLTLTAVKHRLQGVISTQQAQGDIVVTIRSSIDGIEPTVLGPLKADGEETEAASKDEKQQSKKSKPAGGVYNYRFMYWARSGETLDVSAKSAELLFYPDSVQVSIQADSCPGEAVRLEGRPGLFIVSKVTPALAGATVRIAPANDPENIIITMETNEKGTCRVGPLHGDQEYVVMAEKEGYTMTRIEGKQSEFKAFKLGEISVQVLDEKAAPLGGVLLSLSGGAGYRSNKLSLDDGTMTFLSLSPGQYFLRPMMKEYRFEPASQMLDVTEGSTVSQKIQGTRVAFSVYGAVTSLNGEAEPGVIIEAVGHGQGDCAALQEESKTEQDGTYRIRGLQPKCQYEVQLKTGDVNQHIERSAPRSRPVKVVGEDVRDVNIIAFRRMNQMDLSGNVITSQEHLSTLKARLYKENADSPLHTVSLGNTCFFYLPSLTIDHTNYVVRLDSSLPRAAYDFNLPEISFTANTSHKHFTFNFEPKRKSLEQELNQSSLMILPLAGLVALIVYHYDKLLPFLTQASSSLKLPSGSQSHSAPPSSANLQINPDLLADANVTKKKKVRKA